MAVFITVFKFQRFKSGRVNRYPTFIPRLLYQNVIMLLDVISTVKGYFDAKKTQ